MAAQSLPNQPRNKLMARMSGSDLALLQRRLRPVALKFRQRLEVANRKVQNAYFLERGVASVIAVGGDRRQAEVGIIGCEGMTGVAIVLGIDRSPHDIVMQVEGEGQYIAAEDLQSAMAASASLAAFLRRYAHVFSVQAAHAALANAQGKIEERLARWLLMAQDRTDSREIALTHEFLAMMLGVRRPGVTMALHHLQSCGVIATARGSVSVVDREALEDAANGLYGAPEAEYERLIPAS
jgi:CRP-like cAMP-binding protein